MINHVYQCKDYTVFSWNNRFYKFWVRASGVDLLVGGYCTISGLYANVWDREDSHHVTVYCLSPPAGMSVRAFYTSLVMQPEVAIMEALL